MDSNATPRDLGRHRFYGTGVRRQRVADEPAAPLDEDRWAVGQARTVLLAPVGRRASEPQAVCGDVRPDLGVACARRVAGRLKLKKLGAEAGR